MTKVEARALRRQVLFDPAACEKVFGIELKKQNIIDAVEHLTEVAIKTEDEVVPLPTPLAAAAVLVLKGLVKYGSGKPYPFRNRRDRMLRKLRRPVADPMIVWGRARVVKIKAEAKATGKRIKADDAKRQAAEEAKQKFASKFSWQEIARRIERPGKFARG